MKAAGSGLLRAQGATKSYKYYEGKYGKEDPDEGLRAYDETEAGLWRAVVQRSAGRFSWPMPSQQSSAEANSRFEFEQMEREEAERQEREGGEAGGEAEGGEAGA